MQLSPTDNISKDTQKASFSSLPNEQNPWIPMPLFFSSFFFDEMKIIFIKMAPKQYYIRLTKT